MKRHLCFWLVVVFLLMFLLGGCKASNVNLVVSVQGDGTTTPAEGSHSIAKNTVVTLTATPAAGSVFSHWTGDPVSAGNTILMDSDKSVTAVFVKLQHNLTITVTPTGAGTVNEELVAGRSYEFGQTVHLTPVPNTGYVFDHWAGTDAADVTTENNILMDGDKTLEAVFALGAMTVEVQPDNTVARQVVPGHPAVKVTTAGGSPVSGVAVSVAEKGGALIWGTTSRTTGADGLAVFDDVVFPFEGEYTLVFSSGSLSEVESNTITVDLAGAGDAENPYRINNLFGLDRIRLKGLSAFYRLESDVDAAATSRAGSAYWDEGRGWKPIGQNPDSDCFEGTIDGNGHSIRDLYIARPTEAYVGLIGATGSGAPVVKDLNLRVYITGGAYTGGLAGAMMCSGNAKLQNCHVTGTVIGKNRFVGGLVGVFQEGLISGCSSSVGVTGTIDCVGGLIGAILTDESDDQGTTTIEKCHATGDVVGAHAVGGLFGLVQGAVINWCYASGNVAATYTAFGYAGGFAGRLETATVSNCYARGNVTGQSMVGGFAGYTQMAALIYCYSSGNVVCGDTSQISHYGGFMAGSSTGTATNCFYDRTICGLSDTTCGSVPKTTTELFTPDTFMGWSLSIWNIFEGWYPLLRP